MKILRLYSERRKTGPADPALALCRALQDRGHEVLFAYRGAGAEPRFEHAIQRSGVPATTRFALNRYHDPVDTVRDLIELPRFVAEEGIDLVHTTLTHDHALGALALRALGRRRPPIVRTSYRRDVHPAGWSHRLLLRHLSEGLLTFSEGFRRSYIERFGIDPERVGVLPMAVDADRFDPARAERDMRAAFGIEPDAPLIGIVGRFQRYRRMDLFLRAARRVVDAEPRTRFLVIGRSSQFEETVRKPRRELGLEENVVIAGYRTDDYADTLAALDVFTMLVAGSDGTARALREAMAARCACVVSDRGLLPEIAPHGEAGLVSPLEPDALADAWLQLVRDPERRRGYAERARRIAQERFRVEDAAEALERFYERILRLHAADGRRPARTA